MSSTLIFAGRNRVRYSKDLKKIDIPETPPRELSVEELKAAAEKLGYRVSKKPKK